MKYETTLYWRLLFIRLYTILLIITFGLIRIIYELPLTIIRIILIIPVTFSDSFYDIIIDILSLDVDDMLERSKSNFLN